MKPKLVIEWLKEIIEVLEREDCAQDISFATCTIRCWRDEAHNNFETCEYRLNG